jgi:hypothetical protein
MGKVLSWLRMKRVRLQQHFDEKPTCSPTREWWLVVLIIQPLVKGIEKTFLSLQENNTLVQEQRQEFAGLIHDISFRCKLKEPLTVEEQFEFSQELVRGESIHGFLLQHYAVTWNDIFRFVDEVREFVQSEMDILQMSQADNDKQEIDRIVSTVASFSLDIVVGVSKIVAERNSGNKASDALPPVLPLDLYYMDARSSHSRCRSSNFDSDNVLVTRISIELISSSGT